MKIAFYAGKCLPIHARSLDERPLGGTETGIIRLAEILQQHGHDITVFTSHWNPPPSVPRYLPHEQAKQMGPFDIFISIRDWWPAFLDIPSAQRWFWTGDCYDQYINFGLGDKRVVARIDRFLTVSNWQAQQLCEVSGFPLEKTCVIGNGVHLPYFEGQETRARKRLIYTSAPYRGLELVPPLLMELRKRHPDLEFQIFSGFQIYSGTTPFQGPEAAEYDKLCWFLKSIPGCLIHGNLKQQDLAREYMKSTVFFYPNFYGETSCITAIEAMAAGCVPVTSSLGALPETLGNGGFAVSGIPGSHEHTQNFIETTDRLLSDNDLFNAYSQNALSRAKTQFSWEHVADRFETLAHQPVKAKPDEKSQKEENIKRMLTH